MDLVGWIEGVRLCAGAPQCLDLDVLEDALVKLSELADQNLSEYGQPRPDLDESCRHVLLSMAHGLARFCDHLDAFLDELDFSTLADAWSEALALARLRDGLMVESKRHGYGAF